MTDKEEEVLLKDVVASIGVIKAQYEAEVIKDYEIPRLVNMKGEHKGFGVKLQLNTSYDYNEATLTKWEGLLKADEWYISVKRNQLHVTFKVRFNKNKEVINEISDDKHNLTEFECVLLDICRGWIGEEVGWKEYIKDNADVLIKIVIKKLHSLQDVPLVQKPAE